MIDIGGQTPFVVFVTVGVLPGCCPRLVVLDVIKFLSEKSRMNKPKKQ